MPSQRKDARREAPTGARAGEAAAGADVRSADDQRRAELREEQSQARAAQRAERDPKNPFARPAVLINGVAPRWPIPIHQPEASMSAEERAAIAAGQEQVNPTPRGGTNAPHALPEE